MRGILIKDLFSVWHTIETASYCPITGTRSGRLASIQLQSTCLAHRLNSEPHVVYNIATNNIITVITIANIFTVEL